MPEKFRPATSRKSPAVDVRFSELAAAAPAETKPSCGLGFVSVLTAVTAREQSTQSLQQTPLHRRGSIFFVFNLLRTVSASSLRTERMLDRVALRGRFGSGRLAGNGASDRFLNGAIVVVLNLGVVGSFPVD